MIFSFNLFDLYGLYCAHYDYFKGSKFASRVEFLCEFLIFFGIVLQQKTIVTPGILQSFCSI